ncbi:50S ribosomal protein L21 [Candidatus Gracilibacteria bacterium]|nr:50S ribosomal protein L21 [Candidatus Gracilibacteria bacterium]
MIAVAKIGGHQALVQIGDELEVDKLDTEVGKNITLDTLLISEEDGTNFQVGTPFLDVKVEAKILEHGRGRKVKVFKMKPRKRYRRTLGHRQDYTLIEITKIGASSAKPVKKEVVVKETKVVTKKEVTKVAPKKTTKKTVVKKTVAKKPATKKPAAKKTTKK